MYAGRLLLIGLIGAQVVTQTGPIHSGQNAGRQLVPPRVVRSVPEQLQHPKAGQLDRTDRVAASTPARPRPGRQLRTDIPLVQQLPGAVLRPLALHPSQGAPPTDQLQPSSILLGAVPLPGGLVRRDTLSHTGLEPRRPVPPAVVLGDAPPFPTAVILVGVDLHTGATPPPSVTVPLARAVRAVPEILQHPRSGVIGRTDRVYGIEGPTAGGLPVHGGAVGDAPPLPAARVLHIGLRHTGSGQQSLALGRFVAGDVPLPFAAVAGANPLHPSAIPIHRVQGRFVTAIEMPTPGGSVRVDLAFMAHRSAVVLIPVRIQEPKAVGLYTPAPRADYVPASTETLEPKP